MYCTNCGHEIAEDANYCPSCGFKVRRDENRCEKGQKSQIGAGLLGLFLGVLGVHNFYLGYIAKGLGQLFMTLISLFLVLIGIFSFNYEFIIISIILSLILLFSSWLWSFIEAIMIFAGKMKDGKGESLI